MTLHSSGGILLAFLVTLLLTGATGLLFSRMHSGHGDRMEQWGLGGRQFGTLVTWFLVGGDFYTAYTILAVPALVFGVGAAGFFALPYTILVYPFVFVVMPRLWAVCRRHNLVTSADFVRLRYGSHWLASAVALTGIIAVIPYIALQFSGMESVLRAMGLGSSSGFFRALPILLAFAAVSIFTVVAGLRGPALIAFSKDTMIYIVVLAAVIILPAASGGYHSIFARADLHFAGHPGAGVVLRPAGFSGYATLALGSALAAFLYPHTVTSILASNSANVIRKNAILLPAYTFLLGLIALLGLVAAARGLHPQSPNDVIPALFALAFPPWFLGFAFAAIVIAALVPASIMSIAAANLFTRNVYLEYISKIADARSQSGVAKLISVLINACALGLVLLLPTEYSINLQLLGGVLVLQTFPAIVLGLWKRIFHAHALLAGWLAGLGAAAVLLARLPSHTSVYPVSIGPHTFPIYVGILALLANMLVAILATAVLRVTQIQSAPDGTVGEDYVA